MKRLFLTGIRLFTGLCSFAQSQIDRAESRAIFTIKNLGVKVEGQIRGMSGEVKIIDDKLEESYVNAVLEIRGIRTGIKQRDLHLMEERFFDKSKYPQLTFKSSSITKKEDNKYLMIGNLTIKDVTKKIEVDFVKTDGKYFGTFSINRKDYNVHNSDLLTKGISDQVSVKLEVKLQ